MTTDLWMLVWTAILALLMPTTYGYGRLSAAGGSEWAFGNRDRALPVPAWTERAVRAHANLVENLGPFIILVLVAHVGGKANATTALGAMIFFWARAVYAAVYIAGIIYLRTIVWSVALIGELMILLQLFR